MGLIDKNEQTHCDFDLTKRKSDFSGFVPDLADLDIDIYIERGRYNRRTIKKRKIKELIPNIKILKWIKQNA